MANLKPAKEMTGVLTAYLHHGRAMAHDLPPYIDLTAADTPALLRHFQG